MSQVLENNPKGLSFRVPKADPDVYTTWMDEITRGINKKSFLMAPIPFGCGSIKLAIVRNNTGLNKLHPYFTLYLERPFGTKLPILYGKKRMFNKIANYIISLEKSCADRDDEECLGKLRGLGGNDKFTLYDNGENYSKLNSYSMSQLRSEHGTFLFRYEPCNVGNIRKMLVLLPNVYPVNLSANSQEKYDSM